MADHNINHDDVRPAKKIKTKDKQPETEEQKQRKAIANRRSTVLRKLKSQVDANLSLVSTYTTDIAKVPGLNLHTHISNWLFVFSFWCLVFGVGVWCLWLVLV